MESRIELARERKSSMNCAQAVACTYCDLAGITEEEMARITSALGLGMGNMQGTCGALTGAAVVIGATVNDRVKSRQVMASVMEKFRQRNGATTCHILKGIETRKMLRACPDCVADAAEFLEEALMPDKDAE